MAALLYDAFLVGAMLMLVGFIMQFIFGFDTNRVVDGVVQTDPLLGNILFPLMLGTCFAFYCFFWTRSGQTLGMIAWRIKVVSVTGELISPAQALTRWLTAWPGFIILFIGYGWIKFDPSGDALHDKVSGTRVVLLPKSHRPF